MHRLALANLTAIGLTPAEIDRLRQRLDAATKADLAALTPELPAWMQPVITQIVAAPANA